VRDTLVACFGAGRRDRLRTLKLGLGLCRALPLNRQAQADRTADGPQAQPIPATHRLERNPIHVNQMHQIYAEIKGEI